MTDPKELAITFFRAWEAQDFATLASVLAEGATLRGPLGQADGAEECGAGLRGMSKIVTDTVIEKMVVDGPDVLTWYELHTTRAGPVPTANWIHFENGKISSIRATFDARPLAPATLS